MFGQPVRAARACGLALALSTFLVSGAYAADLSVKDDPLPDYLSQENFWTRPYLLGDLGRTKLAEQGITLSATMVDEAVTNLSGGVRNAGANAGQIGLGAVFDMAKLAGISGATFGITLVDRWGQNMSANDGAPDLQLINEVFGRGDIVRLTEFYWDQKLFNDKLEVKFGRLPVGSDFFFDRCDFINLTFCGGQPGNILGGYIYNWPVSQMGVVVKTNLTNDVKLSVGVYDSNTEYLSTKPNFALLPTFADGDAGGGVLVPVELAWRPTYHGMPGIYKIGGWYNSDDSISAVKSFSNGLNLANLNPAQNRALAALEGNGMTSSRYGYYFTFQQQLTSPGGSYKDAVDTKHGLFAFLNGSFGDHETSVQDYQISFGLRQVGTFASRPDDEIGFAVGTTHINSDIANVEALLGLPSQGNEVPIELYYGWQATPWLNLKFDFQYIIDSGGYSNSAFIPGTTVKNDNEFILGVRTTINF
jgi:porin